MITPKELTLPEDTKGLRYSLIRAWRELLLKINASLIQWRDEGTNIGGVGQVNKVNFTGAGVTATVSNDVLTVNVSGGGGGGLSDGDYGDIVVSGGAAVFTIDADAVTFAKMQNISTAKLLGRGTAGSGDVEEITLGTNLSFSGTTLNVSIAELDTTLSYIGDKLDVVTTSAGTKTMGYTGDKLTSITGTGIYPSKNFTYTGDLLTGIDVL